MVSHAALASRARTLVLVFLSWAGLGHVAVHAQVCTPLGGSPGMFPGGSHSGWGSIGPDASPIGGRAPDDFIAELLDASPQGPEAKPPGCPPSGGENGAASEPASLQQAGPGQGAGNPVDLVTGNKYARQVDVELPDPESGLLAALREALGGDAERVLGDAWRPFTPVRLAFGRHYNSRFASAGPLGPGWRHGFETALARLRGAQGIELQVVQADGRRLVLRRTEAAGAIVRYASGDRADGQIEEDFSAQLPWVWRWPDGRRLRFDREGRLARIEAPDQERLVLHRDRAGRLQRVEDLAGRTLWLHYAGERLVALVLPDGAQIGYGYDRHGVLERVRYPDGRTVKHHYEDLRGFHLLTGIEAPDGSRSHYRYDDSLRVVASQPGAASATRALSLSYRLPDTAGGVGETTVREGDRVSIWRWRIDGASGAGTLLSMSGERCSSCPRLVRAQVAVPAAGSLRRELSFDRFGLPGEAKISGAAAGSRGRREPIAMHLRWHRHAEGSLAGKLAWVERLSSEGIAARTVFRHDARRALVAVEHPEGLLHAYERDSLGRAVTQRRADRTRSAARFDRAWRLVEWRRGKARHTVAWNEEGRPSAIGWPSGERWAIGWKGDIARIDSTRGWTVQGARAMSEPHPAVAGVSSTAGGAPAIPTSSSAAFPGGAPTGPPQRASVALVRSEPHPVVVDAAGRRTDYHYDDFGRLIEEVSSATGTKRYRYDAWGRAVEIVLPDGTTELRRHDLAGRLLERELRGPGEPIVSRFAWDAALLVGVEHPVQGTRARYDEWGQLVALEHGLLGSRQTIGYERDDGGRVVALALPDGSRLRHRFDETGRPVALLFEPAHAARTITIVDRVAYRNGRIVSWRYGNGVRFEREDDPTGRPVALRWRGREVLADWRYRWRDDGLLAAIVGSDSEQRFGWDAFGRLIVHERHARRRAAPDTVEAEYFAWDLAGDLRLARRMDGTGWEQADVAPRDASGRRSRHEALALRYGGHGRIAEVSRAGETVARYRYNAGGARVVKETPEGGTGYVYHGRMLAAETDRAGRIVRHYVRWHGQPVAIVDLHAGAPAVTWLHTDHLGTPHEATDARGRRVWRAEYEAFGRVAREEGSFRQPLRFAGQYHDPETGLHDNYLRSYDPATASYLEPDPLGLAGGLNRWSYVDGNPLLATDPLGLILFAFDGTMNGNPPRGNDSISNVVKFLNNYNDGRVVYVTGVGLDDKDSGIETNAFDAANANTARDRVNYMFWRLENHLNSVPVDQAIDVDVVGWSRGAAMAIDFVNQIDHWTREHYWHARGFCLNLRFLGLWDVVSQFGENGSQNHRWQLSIPSAVGAAFHAVALNEHRVLFPLESQIGSNVIERGFVGSHADLGGSNSEGDLSDVALVWMMKMAEQTGVAMAPLPEDFLVVEAPLVHERSILPMGDKSVIRRDEFGKKLSEMPQREASIEGMNWRKSQDFIRYFSERRKDADKKASIVGEVDMAMYSAWLKENYGFAMEVK